MSLSWRPRPGIEVTSRLIDEALLGGASPADIVIWLRSVMVSRGADPADGWVLEVPRRFSFWMSNNLIQPNIDWSFIRFRTGEEIRVERPMQQADVLSDPARETIDVPARVVRID